MPTGFLPHFLFFTFGARRSGGRRVEHRHGAVARLHRRPRGRRSRKRPPVSASFLFPPFPPTSLVLSSRVSTWSYLPVLALCGVHGGGAIARAARARAGRSIPPHGAGRRAGATMRHRRGGCIRGRRGAPRGTAPSTPRLGGCARASGGRRARGGGGASAAETRVGGGGRGPPREAARRHTRHTRAGASGGADHGQCPMITLPQQCFNPANYCTYFNYIPHDDHHIILDVMLIFEKDEKKERAFRSGLSLCLVLFTKTGPQCHSVRCKLAVSLAQEAVHAAEGDHADPVFVRSTTELRSTSSQLDARS